MARVPSGTKWLMTQLVIGTPDESHNWLMAQLANGEWQSWLVTQLIHDKKCEYQCMLLHSEVWGPFVRHGMNLFVF